MPTARVETGWRRDDAGNRGRPLIIAHRGASHREIENTLAAFALADTEGADGVELDVLLCASGEVVVFHDDDLLRLADRPERVGHLPLASLRKVHLHPPASNQASGPDRAAGRANGRGTPAGIPTLAEAFEACGPRLLVNVELKSAGTFDTTLPRLAVGVSRAIEDAHAGERVIVSSFDPRAVALWQRLRPDVPAALLIEHGAPWELCKAMTLPLLRPAAVHPQSVLCRPQQVAAWRAAGYLVNTWTVDDPTDLRRLAAMGVDGLITNDPAAALEAVTT